MVALRIGLGAQLGHRLAIHLDPPGGDQLFCLASRGDSGGSNNLLQTLLLAFPAFRNVGHGLPSTPGEVSSCDSGTSDACSSDACSSVGCSSVACCSVVWNSG